MKNLFSILVFIFLTGCASSGYNPHYIVSDSIEESFSEQETSQ